MTVEIVDNFIAKQELDRIKGLGLTLPSTAEKHDKVQCIWFDKQHVFHRATFFGEMIEVLGDK